MKLLLLLISFLLLPSVAGATSVTLQQGADGYSGVEDTHIYKNGTDTNYNTEVLLKQSNEFANYIQRTLIKFDLTSLSGATINSATLYMYRATDTGYATTVGVFRVLKPWTNSGATWNDWITTSSEWGTAGCDNSSDLGDDNTGDGTDYDRAATALDSYSYPSWEAVKFWDFDITVAVQNWVNGDWDNNGLVFVVSGGTFPDESGFHSSEYITDTAKRPKLVIDYTAGAATSRRIMVIN